MVSVYVLCCLCSKMKRIVVSVVLFFGVLFTFPRFITADLKQITDEDWQNLLEGEWLVMFYAPWCPACKSLIPTWDKLGQRSFDLSMNFAKVDVTENAVLSGRFFITSLPTIYHIRDGEFRQYRGQRMESEIVAYLRDELWKELAPLPWYRSPTSVHMAAVGMFFQFSINIRDMHASMTEDYGIPVWGSYLIFAIATIILGLLIGLMIVCLCDALSRPQYAVSVCQSPKASPSFTPKPAASAAAGDNGAGDAKEDVEPSDVDDFDLLDDENGEDVVAASESKPQPSSAGDADASPDASSESTVRRRETTKPDQASSVDEKA